MQRSTGAKRRDFLLAAGAAGASALAPAAWSQPAKWPSKPIRIVVAFPPGGLTDAYARHYAEFLGARLGQQVLVENKPGGGAIIGIDFVAKSPPDGHTLLMTTSGTVWQNRVLYTKLPYNLDKDLTPVVFFPSGPLVVGVPEKLGVTNFKEFIAYAKKNPTSMGTYAPGSYPHMVADQTNRAEGTKIQAVHYRGEAPMWVDVAGGQTQVAIGSYQAFNTVSTRGVRPIGVTGSYRSPKLPDVPTLVEQGIEGRLVALEGGLPLMAPAGTPEPVLQLLSRAAVDWSNTPAAARLRESFAIPNKPRNLAETRKDWERDVPVWIKLAVDLGIKLD
ncbi:Bug family tripartite tricarboxylate transporter substrate binding protein [Ramlibacter pallidus]|uniref:Tripartite tricarboxylate transporter substrate binding protein n=1 Tax=Ramlibacter pallidus TaxID=2780087 RepID=A0ABR9S623_9BURK|nr:tripartite tricarboxylate transporter substrate binding protein [Ramlibacter pallidus]MBE7368965.1 tripartite tricarboxylate transporter substrate binding protein [Ramlibacter pallidus]